MKGKYKSLAPIVPWRQHRLPLELAELFPEQQECTLEIGFGNGEFLSRQAREHPARNFLGVEIHWGSVRRTLRRLAQIDVHNVRLIQADANLAVDWMLPVSQLHNWVALFPCPWPKRTHERHRLFSQGFMRRLNPAFRPGAPGLVVTDDAGLRDYALAQSADSGWSCRLEVVSARYDTKYERRWAGQGQSEFFELHFRKEQELSRVNPLEAPLNTLYVDKLDPDTFDPQGCTGELNVHFKNRLYDPVQRIFMILTIVVEEGLNQKFWVQVADNQEKGWAITPAAGSGVLPTRGIQRALELLVESSRTR